MDKSNVKMFLGGKEMKPIRSKMSFKMGHKQKVRKTPVSINLRLKKSCLKLFEKGEGLLLPIRDNEDLPDTDFFISFE